MTQTVLDFITHLMFQYSMFIIICYDKKYRRARLIIMNNKNKNRSGKKDSHSRQHNNNQRSTSRSADKYKGRSESKLALRNKNDGSALNATQTESHILPLHQQGFSSKKNLGKHGESSNEYYQHYKVKSKSKGKTFRGEQELHKAKYLNSIYMHKQTIDLIQHDDQVKADDEIPSSTNNLLRRVKLFDKNGAIDANGKFVVKQTKNQYIEHPKYIDSLQTISQFDGEKKKNKKKQKKQPLVKLKSKRDNQAHKISLVRSADKIKKKDIRDINSPSILQQHTQKYHEEGQKDNPFIRGREPIVKTINQAPILSTRTSKTILSEQTQTSPQFLMPAQPTPKLSFENISREIQCQQNNKLCNLKLGMLFKGDMIIQRLKCIQLIAKICYNMGMRRESLSLAVFYMDRYVLIIEREMTIKNLRLLSLTCLMLALKMDDGIMSRKLCYQFLNHMDSIIHLSQKTFTKSKSIQKHKDIISTISSKETSTTTINRSRANLNSSELTNRQLACSRENKEMGNQNKKSRQQKKSRRDDGNSKQMGTILALQLDILNRFGYKLMSRSLTYWCDLLSMLWDNYLSEELIWDEQLLFRCENNKRNISHLYQLVQRLMLDVQMYLFSRPVLVLSVMYLIIRMRLEQEKQGIGWRQIYARYVASLSKSSNMLFYDGVGANQLFGTFLNRLNMDISSLMQSIQYVGRHFCNYLRTFSFNSKSKFINGRLFEHQLSIYQINQDIYRIDEH